MRARLSKEYFETLLKAVLITVASGVIAVTVILSITGEFNDFVEYLCDIIRSSGIFSVIAK